MLNRLQSCLNSAARLVTHTKKHDHITPVLQQLHWLPIEHCISFKILSLVFKALHSLAPPYICDLLHPYVPSRSCRSSDQDLLEVPRVRMNKCGGHAFEYAAPKLYNALPPNIKSSATLPIFKKHLKTHLFRLAFESD